MRRTRHRAIEVPQIDWRYPDYRRVIPSKPAEKIEHKSYDPEYLMLFKKASKLLGGTRYPIIHPNDIVDIGLSNVVGVQASLSYASVKKDGIPVVDVAPSWLEVPQKQPTQPVETAEGSLINHHARPRKGLVQLGNLGEYGEQNNV